MTVIYTYNRNVRYYNNTSIKIYPGVVGEGFEIYKKISIGCRFVSKQRSGDLVVNGNVVHRDKNGMVDTFNIPAPQLQKNCNNVFKMSAKALRRTYNDVLLVRDRPLVKSYYKI